MYSHLDRIQFDPYNESEDFWMQVEAYKRWTSYYPEAVLADQIYRTKENLRRCRELGIRLSGPKFGRKKMSQEKEEKERLFRNLHNMEQPLLGYSVIWDHKCTSG
ncbi:MAG: transposase [Smithella sp.]